MWKRSANEMAENWAFSMNLLESVGTDDEALFGVHSHSRYLFRSEFVRGRECRPSESLPVVFIATDGIDGYRLLTEL